MVFCESFGPQDGVNRRKRLSVQLEDHDVGSFETGWSKPFEARIMRSTEHCTTHGRNDEVDR